MADEKPRKERKTTARAPRKRATNQATNETTNAATPNEARAGRDEAPDSERPMIAIEQSSEMSGTDSGDVDEIRQHAYELYLSRGGADGDDLSDWLEAERIVRLRRENGASRTDASDRHQH